jgi:tetratricopeptide (TPR) repeat protein
MVAAFRRMAPLIVSSLLTAASATAAPPSPAAAAPRAPQPPARAQVDGITGRVTDLIWNQTDAYWHDGDYDRIIDLARVVVEIEPNFVEAWGVAAWLLWSRGDTPGADAFLAEGARRNPDRYELHYELGWHLFNTKRFAQALPHLQTATRFSDADQRAWKNLAHTYERLDRWDDALAAWRTVVSRFPNDTSGPVNLRRVEARVSGTAGSTAAPTPRP